MHVNTQVRAAFKAHLEQVVELQSVTTSRGDNVRLEELPAAVIGTFLDTVAHATKGWQGAAPLETRVVTVSVVLIVEGGSENLDDELDALRAKIEARVGADEELGGIAKRVEHTGGEIDIGTDEEGDRWFAFLALSWEVEVWTHRGQPEEVA